MDFTPDQCRALIDPRWIGKRVAVAMSGGVDSSVSAIILAKAGCDVIGFTMKLWDYAGVGGDQQRDGQCCTVDAFNRCRAVADRYGFPHYTLDFTEQFERDVIGCFVSEYKRGRTPNPCIGCNSRLRWPALWDKVSRLGCAAIATGHYAVLHTGDNDTVSLHRGADPERDQSYFLWQVPAEYLKRTIFPLGTLLKTTVRDSARAWELPTAETAESRDICFVADGDLERFLDERIARDGTRTSGAILDRDGNEVGRHNGFESMTIGQRRGLGVALGRPQYVVRIDPESASVTIGDNADLFQHECCIADVQWLGDPRTNSNQLTVQIRYRHTAAPASVDVQPDGYATIRFDTAQRAITPGQSAVIYSGDRVIGGGLIESVGTTPSH
jgi:tRNA-specific 2-thiouridylase